MQLTESDAVLDVNRKAVRLPKASLDVVFKPPRDWTIVRRPADVKGLARTWEDKYVVCPACRNRAPLKGNPYSLRCPRCDGLFRIGWDEWFFAAPSEGGG